ncbi:MAG TPA: hypothetical protein VHM23_18010 [Actinomycetota bacterium]|jgi:hypothetical protein|nr:hypothetical protein [Actinomycetota bacterium]
MNRLERLAAGRWTGLARPRLAWWLCASSLLLMTVGLALLALSRHARFPPSMDPWDEQALVILQFLGAPILGGLIAARRPASVYGWLWFVIGLGVGLDAFARGYATFGLLGRPGALPGVMVAAWATNFTWILGLGLLPLVLLLFPDGRPPTRRWAPLAWLVLVLAAALPLEGVVSPGSLQLFPFLDNPLGVTGGALGWLVQAFGQVAFRLFLATLPAAALALALRFRRSRGVERQQLKWFAAAGLILVAVPVADTISPFGFDSNRLIELLSTWPLYAGIGIAILRYRLYDIDRLLNRTLVYGLLTVILGLGYGGAVLVAGQLFGGLGGQPPSWAVAGATLATAALFQPARRRIQAIVDRRFNRRRYDAAATIQAFATRLRQQLDLDALTGELLAVVDQTMEPTRTSLWLRPTSQPPERPVSS